MGYEGVKLAVDLAKGAKPAQKTIDTGTLIVDAANINSAEVQDIINPK
ncbi:hypothetical protein [Parasphaerochaeta coccoides]|nr:hypothetical protein [Parasphaerochaeta coccoides]